MIPSRKLAEGSLNISVALALKGCEFFVWMGLEALNLNFQRDLESNCHGASICRFLCVHVYHTNFITQSFMMRYKCYFELFMTWHGPQPKEIKFF